ncbi:phage tail protein [Actinomycetospora lemnae]|uniref:Phage tail protein n=1 Tax=Actinomycetospora lemnae TaxID=3019891 RepID=A0ABT5SRL3_9PSEU|nr:phage tail protein [Actinomycetospora sp. DW7H6]MDD7965482.1 phage tail protein [Actinomycetospora sp. DW7H6]
MSLPDERRLDLVPAFWFRVRLVRSAVPSPTLTPSPDLTGSPRGSGPPRPTAATAGPDQLGDGGFAECSGLDLDVELRELAEGGRNDGVVRRVGRVKAGTITLRRGMLVPTAGGGADGALWDWIGGMIAGTLPVPRYDGHVEVHDAAGRRVLAHWSFVRGLPAKVAGPALNAKTGEIALEELQIAHEGLRLETTAATSGTATGAAPGAAGAGRGNAP